jgi:hypothetical protein
MNKNKKALLQLLLLLPALPTFAAECAILPSAKLAHMHPAGLTRHYIKLGAIKNAWLLNSGMNHPEWYSQVQKCDREADRVQQFAKQKGMDLFELETSGRYTGLLGTDSVGNAPDANTNTNANTKVEQPHAAMKKSRARVVKTFYSPSK